MENVKENDDVALTDTVDVNSEEQNQDQNNDFDPNAFLTEDVDSSVAAGGDDEGSEVNDDSNVDSDSDSDDDILDWNIDTDHSEETTEETQEEEKPIEKDDSPAASGNGFLSKFKDIGIEAATEEELLEKVKKTIEDKISIETKYVTNDKIDFWKKTLSLNNKDLVKKELAAKGFEGEELEQALQTLEDNNTLTMKAKEVRFAIRESINSEIAREKANAEGVEAKRIQAQAESRAELKKHLDSTETMFGFKMAKKADDLPKIREAHFKYINEGGFLKDALKDPSTISEVAWFVKNREVIINALKNQGQQTAKKEILSDIGAHSKDDTESFMAPSDDQTKAFDPDKFNE